MHSPGHGDVERACSRGLATKLSSTPVTLVEVTLWKRLALVLFLPVCLRARGIFEIHGYIQGRFTNQEGTLDRLEIRRARVILSGDPLSKLSYTFQIDVVKRPFLMDAALTWKFSRSLRLTGGQFKIPFSAESLISDNLNTPIARARAVNALAPGRDTGVQGRDLGLQLTGTLYRRKGAFVEYAAGVFRGQTLVDAPMAHYPATAGRVMVHPLPELTVGGDWYGSFSAPAGAEKRRGEVEGSYKRGPILLRAEQIWARTGRLAPLAALGTASPHGLANHGYPQDEYDLHRLPRGSQFLLGQACEGRCECRRAARSGTEGYEQPLPRPDDVRFLTIPG